MDEKLSGAIEVLLSKLEQDTQRVSETKKMINSLRSLNGEEPLFHDVDSPQGQNISRPDIFYGKPFSTAAREFLESKKRACSTEEILRGFEQGGFDFEAVGWKEKDRLRSLAISLAKNSAVFHKLPNGTFGLWTWYPEVAKRKTEKDKIQESLVEIAKKLMPEPDKETADKENIDEK